MGTFQGHLLPGAFFIAFSLWWTVQITKRVWICSMKSVPFYNTVSYNGLWGRCLHWPVEGIVKIALTGIGMSLELLASTDYGSAGRIVFWGDIQHVTMYSFFFISGVCEILVKYRRTRCCCAPPGLDYAASALAFSAEFLLFKFHLHGRTPLDVLVHTLLLYAVAGCVIATLVEYKYTGSVMAGYTRAFCVLLQGTWFIQVGLILYPPLPSLTHWESEDHNQMMLATMMFAWHCAADIILMIIIVAVARHIYQRVCFIREGCEEYDIVRAEEEDDDDNEKYMMTSLAGSRSNGGRYVNIGNDRGHYESFDNDLSEDEEETLYEKDCKDS